MFQISASCGEISHREIEEMVRLFELAFGHSAPSDFAERINQKVRPLAHIAWSEDRAVGYKLGYDRRDGIFYSWLGGVDPGVRRAGIARALLRHQHDWLAEHGYSAVRTESTNQWKPMIQLNLAEGFDITGTYLEPDGRLKIVMEKQLAPIPS